MKKLYITLILIATAYSLHAQSSLYNYIRTRTYTNNTATQYLDQIEYIDGLGQPFEVVQKGITPSGQDIILYREYDGFGFAYREWLPVKAPAGNNGAFVNPISIPTHSRATYDGDMYAYNHTNYELSPLKRLTTSYLPGQDIRNASVFTMAEYFTNDRSNAMLICRLFRASGTLTDTRLVDVGSYPAGSLFVTRVTDEDKKTSLEFKDKHGRIVLVRQMEGTIKHDTYYVYDDFGNLCYVLPPQLSDASTISEAGLNQYATNINTTTETAASRRSCQVWIGSIMLTIQEIGYVRNRILFYDPKVVGL